MAVFGYNPLLKSVTRFDPVLYKDAVSNARKKYRKVELVPINTGGNLGPSGPNQAPAGQVNSANNPP